MLIWMMLRGKNSKSSKYKLNKKPSNTMMERQGLKPGHLRQPPLQQLN
jgi:hypothetical protein